MNHSYNYNPSAANDNDNNTHTDEEGEDLKTKEPDFGMPEEEDEEIGEDLNPDLELGEEEE